MISRFFNWWRTTLSEMLPVSWTRSRQRDVNVLEIDLSRSQIVFTHRSGGDSDELGRIDRATGRSGQDSQPHAPAQREAVQAMLHGLRPEKTRCVVRLEQGLRLEKEVRLPLAAEENLRQVLAFEMERHTPFHADDVYFDHQIIDRDPRQRKLDVDLMVVKKPMVDEALGVLSDWDLRFHPENASSTTRSLTFLPRDYRPRSTAALNRALVVLNAVALVVAALIPIYQQERYIDALTARADRARTEAMASVEVRDRIRALEQRRNVIRQAKSGPSTVALLDELTRLLPDGTWLHRLDIKDGEVQFQGLSDAASALIGVVESSPMFQGARFGSPITRDARTSQERFHVTANIDPEAQNMARAKPAKDKEG